MVYKSKYTKNYPTQASAKKRSYVKKRNEKMKPMRKPSVARYVAYKGVKTTTVDFQMQIQYALKYADWHGTGNNVTNTRHLVEAVFYQLKTFNGFTAVMNRYEQVKPLSMTVKAKLGKFAFGTTWEPTGLGGRQNATVNESTPGCWTANVQACIDYDGKNGLGDAATYVERDFQNTTNSTSTWISDKVTKVVAQFPLKQYVPVESVDTDPLTPVTERQEWFSQNCFVDSSGATRTNQPLFGGAQVAIIAYDAVGNGYDGLSGDVEPCLGAVLTYTLKCEFKGEIKAIS